MDIFKIKIKVTVFILVFLSLSFSDSLFAADGPFLTTDKLVISMESSCAGGGSRDYSYRKADNETNLTCYLEAFGNLFGDLSECEEVSSCLTPWIDFIFCFLGCLAGADSCEDQPGKLSIFPLSPITVESGERLTLEAKGGTAPYGFNWKDKNSDAELNDNKDGTAYYIAGETRGVTDVVQLTDGENNTAEAAITVSVDSCSFEIDLEGGTTGCALGFEIEFPAGAVKSAATGSITIDKTPDDFPSYLVSFSKAFSVQLDAVLELPVKITFKSIDNTADDYLGIYVLEDGNWAFTGGMREGTGFYSYVKDLSVFMVGKGQKKHKSLSFEKVFGESWVNATVAQYILTYPDKDVPISTAYSWPVNDEETVSFPQGKYQFCIEEDDGTGRGWYHELKCSFGPVYNCVLSENQNALAVEFNPNLFMEKDSCPPCENRTESSE